MVLQCISTYVQSTGSYVYTYIQNNNTLHIHAIAHMHVLTLALVEYLRTVYI